MTFLVAQSIFGHDDRTESQRKNAHRIALRRGAEQEKSSDRSRGPGAKICYCECLNVLCRGWGVRCEWDPTKRETIAAGALVQPEAKNRRKPLLSSIQVHVGISVRAMASQDNRAEHEGRVVRFAAGANPGAVALGSREHGPRPRLRPATVRTSTAPGPRGTEPRFYGAAGSVRAIESGVR